MKPWTIVDVLSAPPSVRGPLDDIFPVRPDELESLAIDTRVELPVEVRHPTAPQSILEGFVPGQVGGLARPCKSWWHSEQVDIERGRECTDAVGKVGAQVVKEEENVVAFHVRAPREVMLEERERKSLVPPAVSITVDFAPATFLHGQDLPAPVDVTKPMLGIVDLGRRRRQYGRRFKHKK